jgi:hypothetical protein
VTAPLSDYIQAIPRYARASNLERDFGLDGIVDYHLVEPSLDVLRRITRADTRTLVVTGPYGSGKSSFGLFLDALIGPESESLTQAALKKLHSVDPDLFMAFGEFRRGLLSPVAPVRAMATGRPEPIAATVLRALAVGVERHGSVPARLLDRIHQVGQEASTADVASLFREVRRYAPITLIIDELGVVLDAAAEAAEDGLWLLQDLAEAVAGGPQGQGFIVALQHRSLAEQISGGHELPAGWRKIQGRFEEVAFVESRDAVFSLIPRVLHRAPDPTLDAAIAAWATEVREQAARLSLHPFLPADLSALARCYPLHPTVLLVLPDLTSYYGQRERTLLAFVAGNEPNAVGPFLQEHLVDERPLPSVDLPCVYEFFVGSGSHRLGPPARVSRWAEVERRIREARDLDAKAGRVVRSVALLNLVGRGGAARASEAVLEFAVPGAASILPELIRAGLLTYRSATDEYRIWEGSDLDLEAKLSTHRVGLASEPLPRLLASIAALSPVIAAAHSERTGVLRTFERQYLGAGTNPAIEPDGLILYRVDATPLPETFPGDAPLIVLDGVELEALHQGAIEAAALDRLRIDDEIVQDWVALREVRERYGMAVDALRGRLDRCFSPAAACATLLLDGEAVVLEHDMPSRLASRAADRAFPKTPPVRNEMFSVHELTSMGARARSLLTAAMIDRPGEPALGFERWGPERAMFEALASVGAVHPARKGGSGSSSGTPYEEVCDELKASMYGATEHALSVDKVLTSIERRPYGLRRSLTPVLWLAVMLAEAGEIGLFERGTFLPQLTPDVVDRLVKSPESFTVRHFAIRGSRLEVVREVGRRLRTTPLSPTLVDVVSGLMTFMRHLPAYGRVTGRVSERARSIREAILTAHEPDVLLFQSIPVALDLKPIESKEALAPEVGARLAAALSELAEASDLLIGRVRSCLAEAFDVASGPALRADLRLRSKPLLRHVVDRRMRGFLLAATEETLADDAWLSSLVVATGMAHLAQWSDDSEEAFAAIVRDLGRTHRRLAVLHTEAWANELSEGFIARRVTITQADGQESSQLVWLDESQAKKVGPVIDEAIRNVENLAGPDATRLIIALLTERVMAKESQDDVEREADDGRNHG